MIKKEREGAGLEMENADTNAAVNAVSSAAIAENIRRIRAEIASNSFGEKVTLVAATKTRTAEEIRAAIRGGVDAIAENRAQEFRDKDGLLPPFPRHFIGRLQSNKLKYIVGKADLIESCDCIKLAEEISLLSQKKGVESKVLIEVNVANTPTKGGFTYDRAYEAYRRIDALPAVNAAGFMAMMPVGAEEAEIAALMKKMRALYDGVRKENKKVCVLSAGMSDDYALCVKYGSNAVRIGRGIFGERR